MEITPKSLILDLLSTLPPGPGYSMPVRALVEAASFFGLAESSIRVALARLLARHQVERDERGQYRLGEASGAVSRAIHGWRRLGRQTALWSGDWIGVHRRRGEGRAERQRGDRSLEFLGFRELDPGLFVRPDNLLSDTAALRIRLSDLGLEGSALVFELSGFDAAAEARALQLWDGDGLKRAYALASEALIQSRRRVESKPTPAAMVETFELGGRVIRQLVLDPLLPDEIVSSTLRDALVAQMLDYDAFGRDHWSDFLRKHGVLHRGTPADLRVAEGAERLASVGASSRKASEEASAGVEAV